MGGGVDEVQVCTVVVGQIERQGELIAYRYRQPDLGLRKVDEGVGGLVG